MISKAFKLSRNIAVFILIAMATSFQASAQSRRDVIETFRADLRADRKTIIMEEMKFTEQESEAFWPIYHNYRAEVGKIVDDFVKLVLEYADLYPNVPEEKAREMLKQYTKAEAELLKIKTKYLKQFDKVLPPSKVFRFAQVDSRLDLGTRMAVAASIPLIPLDSAQPAAKVH